MNFHFPFGAFTYLLAARGGFVAMSNVDANLILRNFHKLLGQVPWATAHTACTRHPLKKLSFEPHHFTCMHRKKRAQWCVFGSTGFIVANLTRPSSFATSFRRFAEKGKWTCKPKYFTDSFFVKLSISYSLNAIYKIHNKLAVSLVGKSLTFHFTQRRQSWSERDPSVICVTGLSTCERISRRVVIVNGIPIAKECARQCSAQWVINYASCNNRPQNHRSCKRFSNFFDSSYIVRFMPATLLFSAHQLNFASERFVESSQKMSARRVEMGQNQCFYSKIDGAAFHLISAFSYGNCSIKEHKFRNQVANNKIWFIHTKWQQKESR